MKKLNKTILPISVILKEKLFEKMIHSGLTKFLLTLLLITSTFTLSASDLGIVKKGNKFFFTLNGELWFPKIHDFDVNGGGPFPTGDLRSQVTDLKSYGYNTLMIPFIASWANNAKMGEIFTITQELGMMVIINYNCIWEYNQWISTMPQSIALTYTGNVDAILSKTPNVRDDVFLTKLNSGLKAIIQYGETKSNVIAYQLVDSDFWKACDDAADTYRSNPAKSYLPTTIFSYNAGNLPVYKDWLINKGFTPEELGFDSWDHLFMPWNILNAKNINHWLSWKEFRVFGLSVAALKVSFEYAKTLTNKPIGVGFDGGFGSVWADQENAIHQGLSEIVDFATIFLGWNPPFEDSWRVKSASQYVPGIPIIGFFDVTSGAYVGMPNQPCYPISQVFTTIPWLSGYLVGSGGKIGSGGISISISDWRNLTTSLQTVMKDSLWIYEPAKPKVAVLISKPDTYYEGGDAWRNGDSPNLDFSQKGTGVIFNRAGIPFTEIWHDQDISKYDVVVAPTAQTMIYSDLYTALQPSAVNSFISNGGVFIKGPYPMRNNIKYLYANQPESSNSANDFYLEGAGWSEISSVTDDIAGNIDVRYLETSGDAFLYLPLSSTTNPYEFSITYKDIVSDGFKLQIESPTGWKDIKMRKVNGYNYWRTLTTVINEEDLYSASNNSKCKIKLVNQSQTPIPITCAQWAELSNVFPQTDLYIPQERIPAPTLSAPLANLKAGDRISDYLFLTTTAGFFNKLQTEVVKSKPGDEIVATTVIDGLKANTVVARPYDLGWAIKMGVNTPSFFYGTRAKDWSYPGTQDEKSCDFFSELVTWKKPNVKAFDVLDPDGNNINKKIECSLVFKSTDTTRFAVIAQNHTGSVQIFKVHLNNDFLNLSDNITFNNSNISINNNIIEFDQKSAGSWSACQRYFHVEDNVIYEEGAGVGINELNTKPFFCFLSNPSQNNTFILYLDYSTINLEIFNISGQKVFAENNCVNGCSINLSVLRSGIYIAKFTGKFNASTQKLILK